MPDIGSGPRFRYLAVIGALALRVRDRPCSSWPRKTCGCSSSSSSRLRALLVRGLAETRPVFASSSAHRAVPSLGECPTPPRSMTGSTAQARDRSGGGSTYAGASGPRLSCAVRRRCGLTPRRSSRSAWRRPSRATTAGRPPTATTRSSWPSTPPRPAAAAAWRRGMASRRGIGWLCCIVRSQVMLWRDLGFVRIRWPV